MTIDYHSRTFLAHSTSNGTARSSPGLWTASSTTSWESLSDEVLHSDAIRYDHSEHTEHPRSVVLLQAGILPHQALQLDSTDTERLFLEPNESTCGAPASDMVTTSECNVRDISQLMSLGEFWIPGMHDEQDVSLSSSICVQVGDFINSTTSGECVTSSTQHSPTLAAAPMEANLDNPAHSGFLPDMNHTHGSDLFALFPSEVIDRDEAGRPSYGHQILFCEIPGCRKSFTQRHKYNKHVKSHSRQYKCTSTKCSFTAYQKKDLRRHNNTVHKGAKLPCPVQDCPYSSTGSKRGVSRKDALKRHLKSHELSPGVLASTGNPMLPDIYHGPGSVAKDDPQQSPQFSDLSLTSNEFLCDQYDDSSIDLDLSGHF